MFVDGLVEEAGEEGFEEGADVGVGGDGGGEGAGVAADGEFFSFCFDAGGGAEVGEEFEGVVGAIGEGGVFLFEAAGVGEAAADLADDGVELVGEAVGDGLQEIVEDGDVEGGEAFACGGGEGEEGMGFARSRLGTGLEDDAVVLKSGEVGADGVVGEVEFFGEVVDGEGGAAEEFDDLAAGCAEQALASIGA